MLHIYNLVKGLGFKRNLRAHGLQDGPYVRNNVWLTINPYTKTWTIAPGLRHPSNKFASDMEPDQFSKVVRAMLDAVAQAHSVAVTLQADPNLWEDEDDDE